MTDKMQDITPFAGLLPIVELWNQLQLPQIIDTSIGVRKDKGYTDSEQLLSLVLLNLSGGSAVEHLKFLKEQLGMKSFPLPVACILPSLALPVDLSLIPKP